MIDASLIKRILDPSFYQVEADLDMQSRDEMVSHYVERGQYLGLNPCPTLMLSWLKSNAYGVDALGSLVVIPNGLSLHPLFETRAFATLAAHYGRDLWSVLEALQQLSVDASPLHPVYKRRADQSGHASLRDFLCPFAVVQTPTPSLDTELFSFSWYLHANPDVRQAKLSPFRHFVEHGWKQHRDPAPGFSIRKYLASYPDVQRSGLNPLLHYMNNGAAEGRVLEPTDEMEDLVDFRSRENALPRQFVDFVPDGAQSLTELAQSFKSVGLVVAIPFYRNFRLVRLICDSLAACRDELIALSTVLVFVNDSPDDEALESALAQAELALSNRGLDVVTITNSVNKGFIYAANVGIFMSTVFDSPCLLLNSDTELTPGAVAEMMAVSRSDDKFGFVNPLSNNATIATLGLNATSDGPAAVRQHQAVRSALPRFSIVPTTVGFCMLISPAIPKLFGYLDPIFGMGYNEENDYFMRANRKGFVAVLANRAFVIHSGEESFSLLKIGRSDRDLANGIILDDRYPEYRSAVGRYFESSDARARALVEAYTRHKDLVIDLTDLSATLNGTTMLARALVPELLKTVGPERCALAGSQAQVDSLGLDRKLTVERWEWNAKKIGKFGLRLSQPYHISSLALLTNLTCRFGVMMLDTISDDCLYLQNPDVHHLWAWTARNADLLMFNSPYTQEKFLNRFKLGPGAKALASYHSLDVSQYCKPRASATKPAVPPGYVLVFGNHFQHKAVHSALDALRGLTYPVVLVGTEIRGADVTTFASGSLSDAELGSLLEGARVVLLPSLYEGFGFPFLEALAANTPIIVYRSPLNEALWNEVGRPESVTFFSSQAEIRSCVQDSLSPHRKSHLKLAPRHQQGWNRSAREIAESVEALLPEVPEFDRCRERLDSMDILFTAFRN